MKYSVHNEKLSIITITFWLDPIVKVVSKKKKKTPPSIHTEETKNAHELSHTQNMKTPTFLKLFLVCRETSRVIVKWLFVFTLPPTVWEVLFDVSPPATAVICISYDVIWTGVRWTFTGLEALSERWPQCWVVFFPNYTFLLQNFLFSSIAQVSIGLLFLQLFFYSGQQSPGSRVAGKVALPFCAWLFTQLIVSFSA